MVFGIDIGTTSVSGVAVRDGKVVTSSNLAHVADLKNADPGVKEQDPLKLLAMVDAVLERLEVAAGKPERIGWTGQMHGVVGVGESLEPVTPFVTWRDRRRFGAPVMAGWAKEGRKIFKCLSVCGLAIAKREGRCVIDPTFLHAWYPDLADFPREWLPETVEGSMLGDNQAGVYAAQMIAPGCAVVNLGTSGQLSVVKDSAFTGPALPGEAVADGSRTELRPYPGGRTLVCRASLMGGRAFADLRDDLGFSWEQMNQTDNPRVKDCINRIVDDLVGEVNFMDVKSLVGVGNALVRNPALKSAVEKRFGFRCIIPDIPEMAAYGAAICMV